MIFRITFHNNDYDSLLDQIAESISYVNVNIVDYLISPEIIEAFQEDERLYHAWEKLWDSNIEDIDIDTYNMCKGLLFAYIDEYIDEDDEYRDERSELLHALDIEITNKYESKNENGEVLYYFLRGEQSWLIQ